MIGRKKDKKPVVRSTIKSAAKKPKAKPRTVVKKTAVGY